MSAGLFPTESELDQLILGPDSVAWRIASDVRLNMVMLDPLPLPLSGPVWRVMLLPARRAVWLGGVGAIASAVRRRLGIGWNILDEMQFRAIGTARRRLTPVLPAGLRMGGPDQLRNRSEKIRQGPLGVEA